MNILITGITGFVGSNLVSILKQKHTIYGLDIVSPLKDGIVKTFGWNELDQIPSIDVVIHLAGKAHDTKNQSTAKEYFDINLDLTQKTFDWFLQSSATKFIFFSSVKAVADEVSGAVLAEDVVPAPRGPYGESKLAAEQYILKQLQASGFKFHSHNSELRTSNSELKKVYILRPCMIHGPGNKGNLNLVHNLVQKGFPWPLGAFENKRSFCSIDNLQFVIQQLIEKNIEPGIYHVADDEPISTSEIIRLIAASQERKAIIWKVPEKIIRGSAKIGDVLHLPLNSERLKKLTESYVVSNQKVKKALGIEKMPVAAKDGLRKTLESFQN